MDAVAPAWHLERRFRGRGESAWQGWGKEAFSLSYLHADSRFSGIAHPIPDAKNAQAQAAAACAVTIQEEESILDVRLPGEDGMQIARKLREKSDPPIIMLTGRKERG